MERGREASPSGLGASHDRSCTYVNACIVCNSYIISLSLSLYLSLYLSIYLSIYLSLSLSMYVYIYIYMYIVNYVYTVLTRIHTHTQTTTTGRAGAPSAAWPPGRSPARRVYWSGTPSTPWRRYLLWLLLLLLCMYYFCFYLLIIVFLVTIITINDRTMAPWRCSCRPGAPARHNILY